MQDVMVVPPEYAREIKKLFPNGTIASIWGEEKGEVEVLVTF